MGRAVPTWMRLRTAQLATAVAIVVTLTSIVDAQAKKTKTATRPSSLPCGDLVGFQVLLGRQGFSSGEIDGKPGANFTRALAAFRSAHKLAAGAPDCATWEALRGGSAEATTTTYTITDADVKGPFEKTIPPRLADQAGLSTLEYRSPTELLAERFHASPALLAQLNRGVPLTAGREIKVPAVTPFDAAAKPQPDAKAGDLKIQVSKEESALRATRADGTLVFYAPVSSGSVHDPLPPGDYKVIGVSWRPPFHYNPDLFWDAKPKDEKAKIPPGPNNPVGVVWISLDLEHYGIHGTPEPGHVGHTESHGCVRLTNWDAARVASLVKPGTPVMFR
jgi:lipoprotein-anchoring transpeptidase ErfK/SrfK